MLAQWVTRKFDIASLHRSSKRTLLLFPSKLPGLVELEKRHGVQEENFPKHQKKLLHKSHQLLRNSIFVSQKLLRKILTVNSSLNMSYLSWRCYAGLSDRVSLSFMRVGHTRCAVDGYFGLIKQRWRWSKNDTLSDVEVAVNQSAEPNNAVMFNWTWHEWDAFLLQYIKPLRGILKFQHVTVSSEDPAFVTGKASPDGEEIRIKIVKAGVDVPVTLPPVLSPPGMSQARCDYLQETVAPYFSGEAQAALPWS